MAAELRVNTINERRVSQELGNDGDPPHIP